MEAKQTVRIPRVRAEQIAELLCDYADRLDEDARRYQGQGQQTLPQHLREVAAEARDCARQIS